MGKTKLAEHTMCSSDADAISCILQYKFLECEDL